MDENVKRIRNTKNIQKLSSSFFFYEGFLLLCFFFFFFFFSFKIANPKGICLSFLFIFKEIQTPRKKEKGNTINIIQLAVLRLRTAFATRENDKKRKLKCSQILILNPMNQKWEFFSNSSFWTSTPPPPPSSSAQESCGVWVTAFLKKKKLNTDPHQNFVHPPSPTSFRISCIFTDAMACARDWPARSTSSKYARSLVNNRWISFPMGVNSVMSTSLRSCLNFKVFCEE